MKTPLPRTRRDMETAAELRAAGATWDTAAVQVGRQPNVLIRWARVYREEWDRLCREAERRWSQPATAESRGVLRALLRCQVSRIRLSIADKLTRRWLELKAKAAPPDLHAEQSAFIACMEEMTDGQLHQLLADVVRRLPADGGPLAAADSLSPAGAD